MNIYSPNGINLTTAEGALDLLASNESGRHISATVEMAYIALDLGAQKQPYRSFTQTAAYRLANNQYNEMSRGGGAHRAALSWLADKELLTSRPSPSKKYGRIYTPTERLARFAMGYNRWHLDLIEECYGALPGHEPLSAEEMRIRALTSFAGACGLNGARRASMAEMTAASGNHELSVTHQALTGWSAHKRIAASVRTLRDRRIKDYVPLFGAPIHGVRQTTNPRHIPRQSSAPSSERLSSSDVPR